VAGQPLTDADKAYIRDAYTRQESHRDIAAHLNKPKSTIGQYMARNGMRYDGTAQEAANARKHNDAMTRKLAAHDESLTILELEQAHYLGLLRGTTKFRMLVKGAGGAEHQEELDFIPGAERRAYNQAMSAAIMNVTKLAPPETGASEKNDSLVDKLLGTFQEANAANKERQKQAQEE
jgi:hypothetical protein